MRIAFILIGNSRRSNYLDGQTIRSGGAGASGTDTSAILVAEQLAAAGHEVVITTDPLEPLLGELNTLIGREHNPGRVVNGVQYSDIEFTNVENREFDVLVGSLWFQDYEKLPITVTKALIYWCHMQWIYGVDEIRAFAKKHNLALGFVHISKWEKSMTEETQQHICKDFEGAVHSALIPNPMPDDMVRQVREENLHRKRHSFIFHAAWPRGGDVAVEVVRQLPHADKEFHAFDYLMVIHAHKDKFFHKHDGADKLTLYRQLAQCEYFVYPLYTPYQDVHKDTFSCVVADAIALGCTPVTYPLGALPENFDGYCQWVPPPPGINFADMQQESLSKDTAGAFKSPEAIANFTAAITALETDQQLLKAKIKVTGADFILDKFGCAAVGRQWQTFLNKLTQTGAA